MSWTGTYTNQVAVALDELGAAVFFNRKGVTISSLCRAVLLADAGHTDWAWRVDNYLKLGTWQKVALRVLGKALNFTFPNHCESARLGMLVQAGWTIKLFEDPSLDQSSESSASSSAS